MADIDRAKYSEVRQLIIDMLKMDLLGPSADNEVLSENPRHAYVVGMLAPQTELEGAGTEVDEQEVDADMAIEDDADYTAGEDDENEPITSSHFKIPSSMGISFYIETAT